MAITGTLVLCLVITSFNLCSGQSEPKPRIYYLHVQSDVRYRFATTLVTSKVANPANISQEVKFDVTLPDEAYISDFQMEIGGQIYPGEVNEKIVAQKKYDEAKRRGQSAGQVKQQPRHTNRFNVEVNVAAQEKVTFNLTYQELLKRKKGSYEQVIYINPRQIVADLTIDIAIEESRDITSIRVPPLRNDLEQAVTEVTGQNSLAVIQRPTKRSARILYSPTEADQRQKSDQGISGQFVVEYDIDRKSDAGDVLVVNGYFVHFFAPSDMEEIPKDVLMILDVSGSMDGMKLVQMKEAVLVILDDLHEGDRFNILLFSDDVYFYKESPVIASVESITEAKIYVNSMDTISGTNINLGILRGLEFLKQVENINERSQVVLFLTDGEPTSGVTDINQILSNVRKANSDAFPIYSLAFGRGADYEFVKKVAIQNNGLSRKIYEDSDATLQITGFYDEFSAAVLKDLSFQYLNSSSDVQNVTTAAFPSYFIGSEIVVAGKLEDNTISSFDLSVQGLGSEGAVEMVLSADPNAKPFAEIMKPGDYEEITEKIWAYLTIKQLLEKSIGETDSRAKEDMRKRALELSLKYKFVTPLTSMVVTKPEKKEVGDLEEGEDADLTRQDLRGPLSAPTTTTQTIPHGRTTLMRAPPLHPQRAHMGGRSSSYGGGSYGGGGARPSSYGGRSYGGGGARPSSYGGRSYGGGGGGDPHFMIRIKGLDHPLCFDIPAKSGDVLHLLSDPQAGLFINAGIIPSFKFDRFGRMKTFMGEIIILFRSHKIKITPTKFIFDGVEIFWPDNKRYNLHDVTMKIITINKNRVMHVKFGSNIQVSIKRTIASANMSVDYLNLNIDNEAGLSRESDGILGQFLHRFISVHKVGTSKKNQTIGYLRVREPGFQTQRSRSILISEADKITGKRELCWNVHTRVAELFDKNVEDFFIRDIMHRAHSK